MQLKLMAKVDVDTSRQLLPKSLVVPEELQQLVFQSQGLRVCQGELV
jgi:hypothetical protein